MLTAYLPTLTSGVTISQGVDLGPNTVISQNELLAVFGNNKSDPIYKALDSVLTQPGSFGNIEEWAICCSPASPYCVFSGLSITLPQAQMLFDDAAKQKVTDLTNYWSAAIKSNSQYKLFSDLPSEAQTVLFDLHYVGLLFVRNPSAHTIKTDPTAAAYISQSKRFWDDMVGANWTQAVNDLIALKAVALLDPFYEGYAGRISDDASVLQVLASGL
jgi:hypothetical protein